jgi:hypothetical protein
MKKCPYCAEEIQDAAVVCKHCGRNIGAGGVATEPERLKKKTSIATWAVLALVLFVGGLALLPGGDAVTPNSVVTGTRGVTLAQFHQLADGMTYTRAAEILGGPGAEMSRTSISGTTTVMYAWQGSGSVGANMNAIFQNDKLISKAQFGLQ